MDDIYTVKDIDMMYIILFHSEENLQPTQCCAEYAT